MTEAWIVLLAAAIICATPIVLAMFLCPYDWARSRSWWLALDTVAVWGMIGLFIVAVGAFGLCVAGVENGWFGPPPSLR